MVMMGSRLAILSDGREFHMNGAHTKKECLKLLILDWICDSVSEKCVRKMKNSRIKRDANRVINYFVHLATCEDVPTLVQGGPLKFTAALFI
jgi:hypothetical protein